MIKTNTWQNIGTKVNGKTAEEILLQAGLDYEVIKEKVYTSNGIEIPNAMVTRNANNGEIFGIVSDKYEVIQNKDAFDFVDYMVENNGLELKKAGQTKSGMIYIIASMPNIKVLEDEVKPYVIFQNSFNGSTQLKAAIAPLRIICQNQFHIAFKGNNNQISIRHSKTAHDKLLVAKQIFSRSNCYMTNFKELAEELAEIKINNKKIEKIVESIIPIKENCSERVKNKAIEEREKLLSIYKHTDDIQNYNGTGWGIMNAYTDYVTHKNVKNTVNADENKFIRLLNSNMSNVIDIIKAA